MKITKVYPEYVFQRIGAGKEVNAVDHKKKQYVVLSEQIVQKVQSYIDRATEDNSVEFYQIEEEEA